MAGPEHLRQCSVADFASESPVSSPRRPARQEPGGPNANLKHVKSSFELIAANDYEAYLQGFDHREIDATEPRSHWALRYRGRLQAVLGALRSLPPGSRTLEVGASQANTSLLAAEAGLRAVALDRDPRALRYAWRKHTHGAFTAVAGDALALPCADGVFAAVLALEILEHLPAPAEALREMKRVLAPGGLLVVTTPNADHLSERLPTYTNRPPDQESHPAADADGHLFAFTLAELRELLTAVGFQVQEAQYLGSVIMSDRLALKRLLPVGAVKGLSALLTRLPGAARLSYSCFAVARLPV